MQIRTRSSRLLTTDHQRLVEGDGGGCRPTPTHPMHGVSGAELWLRILIFEGVVERARRKTGISEQLESKRYHYVPKYKKRFDFILVQKLTVYF